MSTVSSPFQCGGVAQRLPAGPFKRLIIRCDDTDATARIIGRVDPTQLAVAGKADFFLKSGEALELRDNFAERVSILDISDNPLIYWYRE